MLAIPLPFVAALLLFVVGVLVRCRYPQSSQKPFWFIILCALMVTMVGLRWTVDIALFRFMQPVLGASVPVMAWLCFSSAHRSKPNTQLIWLGPVAVLVCSSLYQYLWPGVIDVLLILLYFGFGVALLMSSFGMPKFVRLTHLSRVLVAERVAGGLLLFSALVDGVLSYDILMLNAQHTDVILSVSYLVLIPAIVGAVMVVSLSTPPEVEIDRSQSSPKDIDLLATSLDEDNSQETSQIISKFDTLMRQHQVFKDPDLSLDRLARKLGIPARKISSAINQTYQQNISKVINSYRIDHAKVLLKNSDEAITDIFLSSGFQTKSNFNREFSRITGQTPSEFRHSPQDLG